MRALDNWPETVGRCLFFGALAGASATIGIFVGLSLIEGGSVTNWQYMIGGVFILFYIFTMAFIVWFFGLALFGLWPWWLLHYLGFRGKLSAAALGFSAPVLVWALFSGGMPSAFGFGMGAVGILVGEVIWFSAYKRGAGAPAVGAS